MTSMLSHSCYPNVEQTISDLSNQLELSMIAVRKIHRGDQIFISYTDLLTATIVREDVNTDQNIKHRSFKDLYRHRHLVGCLQIEKVTKRL